MIWIGPYSVATWYCNVPLCASDFLSVYQVYRNCYVCLFEIYEVSRHAGGIATANSSVLVCFQYLLSYEYIHAG